MVVVVGGSVVVVGGSVVVVGGSVVVESPVVVVDPVVVVVDSPVVVVDSSRVAAVLSGGSGSSAMAALAIAANTATTRPRTIRSLTGLCMLAMVRESVGYVQEIPHRVRSRCPPLAEPEIYPLVFRILEAKCFSDTWAACRDGCRRADVLTYGLFGSGRRRSMLVRRQV